jgi:hypothetical protein
MVVLLGVGSVANLLIRPVDSRHFVQPSTEFVTKGKVGSV